MILSPELNLDLNIQENRDTLIQDYENRVKELKERNIELKRRVGLLEWQVENMKQKMEIQEVSHRRETSALKEKVGNNKVTVQFEQREDEW